MMHRVPNTITQRNKTLHVKQRRLLGHGFSDAALRTYEETIVSHINIFCHHLGENRGQLVQEEPAIAKEQWSAPKDMALWCEFTCYRHQL